jgi:hypothetical protein
MCALVMLAVDAAKLQATEAKTRTPMNIMNRNNLLVCIYLSPERKYGLGRA